MQGAAKQIKSSATRLTNTMIDDSLLQAEKRPVRGDEYEEIATPSFTPGPGNSPIMTWGEVAATPRQVADDGDVRVLVSLFIMLSLSLISILLHSSNDLQTCHAASCFLD